MTTTLPDSRRVAPAARDAERVLAGSARLIVVRAVALALSFGISLVVARELGAAEFGRFEAWLAWAGLAAVGLGLGTDRMVVRYAAAYRARSDWGALRGLLYGLGGITLAASVVVAAIAGVAWALGVDAGPGGGAVLVGVVLVAATVLLRFGQGALQGLDRVFWSQVADLLVLPVAFVAVFFALRGLGREVGAFDALVSQVAGTAVAVVLVGIVFVRGRPPELATARSSMALGEWWSQSWLLLVLAFLQIAVARLDVLVFDLVGDDVDLGRYAAARRIAAPVVAVVLAVNVSVAPAVARLHARVDREGLQAMATRMARWTTLAAGLAGLAIVALGPWVLSWFGPAFVEADAALRIMVAGQVLNAAFGSVVLMLIMTGNTRHALPGLAAAGVVQGVLGWLLIPAHGAVGAAWAATAGTITWNLVLACAVRARLRIDPSVLGRTPDG